MNVQQIMADVIKSALIVMVLINVTVIKDISKMDFMDAQVGIVYRNSRLK